MAFVPCPRGCGKRVLRFALAEHKASCAFGEAGFVPSHTLARTPPARAVASSFPTTDQQESPIGLRGLRSLQRAQPDDAELASLEPLTWSPLRAEEYVSQTLGLPRVGSLLARRHGLRGREGRGADHRLVSRAASLRSYGSGRRGKFGAYVLWAMDARASVRIPG